MADEKTRLTLHIGNEEWSALYVDGKLDTVGDHYLADDRIRELAGVEVIHGDDFLRGGNQREDVAPTLEALCEWQQVRDRRLAEAAELDRQVDRLRDRADALRDQARATRNGDSSNG